MDTVKNFFDSFKEFIWDIIGYFLPGAYLIILLAFGLNDAYLIYPKALSNAEMTWPLFIMAAYLLGHITYGMGWLKERMLGKRSYTKTTEQAVALRPAFKASKELLEKAFTAKGVAQNLSSASVRDVRNLVMSFAPESDQKVYTFTFRSELSNQIGNISAAVGIAGIVNKFIPYLKPGIFLSDRKHLLLYLCLIVAYVFVRQTRNRFYAISIGIPFSIYTAKELKTSP